MLDTIHLAMKQVKKEAAEELQLHSDQSSIRLASKFWVDSNIRDYDVDVRCRNPYDNAMAENFFSILRTECIYRHKQATFSKANKMINRYIHFYNYERI